MRGGGKKLSAAFARARRGAWHVQTASRRHPVPVSPDARPRVVSVLKKRVRPPKHKRLPNVLSDAEVRALLGCVKNPVHKAGLLLMYACGLRISEAAALEVTAIDKVNLLVCVIGKGNKERRVPLPQPVLDELRSLWLTHRNRRWLCPNRRGSAPIHRKILWSTVRQAAAEGSTAPMIGQLITRHPT